MAQRQADSAARSPRRLDPMEKLALDISVAGLPGCSAEVALQLEPLAWLAPLVPSEADLVLAHLWRVLVPAHLQLAEALPLAKAAREFLR